MRRGRSSPVTAAIFLFPQVCGPSRAEDDRIPSRRVAQRLTDAGVPTRLIDMPWTPDALKSAYGQMDLFAGARLHSNMPRSTRGRR
ncbi:MAG: hypothetical protein R2856_20275 [Caldilineaceae bacterium]